MCWYKRTIFSDNHTKLAGLVRKCHLQLAFENAETSSGCGKIDFHLVQSIKVQGACPDCAAKFGKEANMLATIKEQLAQAKTKLRLTTDKKTDLDASDGNEGFSPVNVSFSERKETMAS
ncbi:putative endonuclease lcl3 [Diaporthe australafricana]|uniref:Endonuclease lcl3 n=1 Tax=Diaporthe australafricana TaxID=127596 RepID=A0ABR3W505_9PEZI